MRKVRRKRRRRGEGNTWTGHMKDMRSTRAGLSAEAGAQSEFVPGRERERSPFSLGERESEGEGGSPAGTGRMK